MQEKLLSSASEFIIRRGALNVEKFLQQLKGKHERNFQSFIMQMCDAAMVASEKWTKFLSRLDNWCLNNRIYSSISLGCARGSFWSFERREHPSATGQDSKSIERDFRGKLWVFGECIGWAHKSALREYSKCTEWDLKSALCEYAKQNHKKRYKMQRAGSQKCNKLHHKTTLHKRQSPDTQQMAFRRAQTSKKPTS